MFKPTAAVLIGATLGYLALIPLAALTSSNAARACSQKPNTHTLVTVRAFAGTAKHCVDRRYITPVSTDRTATHYGPAF